MYILNTNEHNNSNILKPYKILIFIFCLKNLNNKKLNNGKINTNISMLHVFIFYLKI